MEIFNFRDLTAGKKVIEENFANWTSGNETIDNFIQEKQLKYDGVEKKLDDGEAVFEWIPYNELIDIKEIGNNCLTTALWKEGPLFYSKHQHEWSKTSCEFVTLKFLYDLQNVTDEFMNKIDKIDKCYGISQNPVTKVYILVFNDKYFDEYCEKCEITDEFFNEVELYLENKVIFGISQNPDKEVYLLVFNDEYFDNYCEKCEITDEFLNEVESYLKNKEIFGISQNPDKEVYLLVFNNKYLDNYCEKCELEYYTLAMWKKGPLYYNSDDKKLVRKSCENIYLKYLHNSQEITDEFLNEIESYLKNKVIFGISQNPDKEVYLLVFNDEYFDKYCEKCDWTSGNEKIDNFIQKMQLKINSYEDKIFEWISYNEFIIIKENYTLAIWEKGPLYCNKYDKKLSRESSKKVYLKYPYNSQEITDEFFNKVESYLKNKVIFGISQNPDTEVYLLVFNDEYFDKYCEKCAIWKDGPLYYSIFEKIYKRELNKKVILKYLCNPQNVNHLFLNEVIYSVEENHGVTQNPNTKDYMLVCKIEYYCENCGKKYNNQFERKNKSCISCQTNPDFKKINDLIQEIKLNIDHNSCISDIMFNWIPYDQFNNIREIGKGGFSTVYSAIWKDALISYESKTWERKLDTRVALKCLSNSQDNLDEFINEVKAYTNQKIDNILKIYGISQNPNTKEYIMVLEYAEGGNFNSYLKLYCKDFNWSNRLEILTNIIEVEITDFTNL
ncbi:kinase-like domain-containing protein [Rhizophagus irregularis DAOM 181602=DAOM 197198]|nr:kinase-like domain-containing protein [Rhizophagus irregularis DAOM 181602=DAOM 197198]